jgi:phage terminase small subunit
MALTPKQASFVSEYLIDKNATQAAIRAGYSAKTADVQGPRLLGNVSVSQAIAQGISKQLEANGITAERTLREIARLGFSDMRKFFADSGSLKAIHTLGDDEAACLASVEVTKKNLTAGDGEIDTVLKVKVWDKPRSLEMLAKHFALLTERIEHSGNVTYKWQD